MSDANQKWYDRILAEAARKDGDTKAACSRIAMQVRNDAKLAREFVLDLADWALHRLDADMFESQPTHADPRTVVKGTSWRRTSAGRAFAAAWATEVAVGTDGQRIALGATTDSHWQIMHRIAKQRSEKYAERSSDAWHVCRYLTQHGGELIDAFGDMDAALQKRVARYSGLSIEALASKTEDEKIA